MGGLGLLQHLVEIFFELVVPLHQLVNGDRPLQSHFKDVLPWMELQQSTRSPPIPLRRRAPMDLQQLNKQNPKQSKRASLVKIERERERVRGREGGRNLMYLPIVADQDASSRPSIKTNSDRAAVRQVVTVAIAAYDGGVRCDDVSAGDFVEPLSCTVGRGLSVETLEAGEEVLLVAKDVAV